MKEVIITGPEGVGKTTQISLLLGSLKRKGLKVKYEYIRSSTLPVRLIKKMLMRTGRKELTKTKLGAIIIDVDSKITNKIINLFALIDFVFVIFKIIYIKTILNKFYNIIIYERYLNDLMLDYYYSTLFHNVNKDILRLMIMVLSAISRKSSPTTIILDADLATIIGRQIVRKRTDLYIFTMAQKSILGQISKIFSPEVYTIDTSRKSIAQTHMEIEKILEEVIRNGNPS